MEEVGMDFFNRAYA